MKDDSTTAIKGVLWSSRGPWLTLRAAALLRPGAEPMRIDGDVVIPRANVAFLQVLP